MNIFLMPPPLHRGWTNAGVPAAGCKLYTYEAGTSTPKETFQDAAGTIPHENPITLDAKGEALIYWSGSYRVDLRTAAGVQITGYPVDDYTTPDVEAAADLLRSDLAEPGGAELVKFTQTGSDVLSDLLEKVYESKSVIDYGADPTGVADSTLAIRAAIVANIGGAAVFFPAGTYLVTDTISLYKGTVIYGVNTYQGNWEYASGAVGSKIVFSPTTTKDLFVPVNLPLPVQSFISRISVSNLWISGNANARYAFDLDHVIYSSFEHMQIIGFDWGVTLADTINNDFGHLSIGTCRMGPVLYGPSAVAATTDVWTHCTFNLSPKGVEMENAIGVRFVHCLFEALDTYGAEVGADCQNIQFTNCYAEDVPFVNVGTNAMFKIGYNGGASSLTTVAQITGGSYAGRNAGLAGSFLDVDTANGVQVTNVNAARFTNLINTTANTADYAVCCAGLQWLSCTNAFNDDTKLSGFLDFSAVNAGFGPMGYFAGGKFGNLTTGYITFDPSNPAGTGTVTSNELDDYEEGTFVPALKFGGLSVGITGTMTGFYTKIGRDVRATVLLILTSKGSSVGSATVTGLPFTALVGTAGPAVIAYQNATGLPLSSHYADISSTTALLRSTAATGFTSTTDANFTNTTVVNFTAIYSV